MRVALVFPPFYHASMYNLPPLGLINLGTLLKQQGHRVTLHDQVLGLRDGTLRPGHDLYAACARQILAGEPEVVAFSTQCTTYPPSVAIAARLRALAPQLRLVIGGHNATFVAAATLQRHPAFDAVVCGEGERSLSELVAAYSRGEDGAGLAGVCVRRGGEVISGPQRDLIPDLNALPLPDYTLAPELDAYRQACNLPRSVAILEVGRGCPHDCIYCSEAGMWRRRCRTFAVPRLVEEMRTLVDNHGADCFLLAYDQFTADRRFVEAFCHGVLEAGLERSWYCISRLDTVDRELLALMRRAGCESMCYGIDSGSKRTLAFIRKQIDPGILHRRVEETVGAGMVPTLSFVIGFPEERREDIDATLRLALQTGVRGNANPLMQIPTVLPGTDLHRRYLGTLVRGADSYFALGIEFDHGRRLDEDERHIDADPELFSSFYNLPCAGLEISELSRLAEGFPLIVRLFPRSFLLLCRSCSRSESRLFAAFLEHLEETQAASDTPLSPPSCYAHFPDFARRRHATTGGKYAHLDEILLYETCAIEVARPVLSGRVGTIDLSGVSTWQPRLQQNVRVAQFRYPLPQIIDDLQRGVLRDAYPEEPSALVFRQQDQELEVQQINLFGHDLLRLCGEGLNLTEIATRLYPLHAGELGCDDFLDACVEAVRELSDRQLLYAASA